MNDSQTDYFIRNDLFYSQIDHPHDLSRNLTSLSSSRQSLRELRAQRIQRMKQEIEQERLEDVAESLDASREEQPADKQQPAQIGDKAIRNYYQHYKRVDKVKEENSVHNLQDSAFTICLDHSKSHKLFPSKLGVVKAKGKQDKIEIANYKFGDKYIQCLSQGLVQLPHINSFNLRQNRITELGASAILNKMGKNMKVLDLSQNNIGKIGCELLASQLEDRACRLDSLNLEGNRLGDKSVSLILQALEKNYSLQCLNLSNNYLSNKSMTDLCEILQVNDYLNEIYLNWNQIKADGGRQLFQALQDNDQIRVLDISWNCLGEIKGNSCLPVLAECLERNTALIHLDLSNNSFSLEESMAIAKGLEKNRSIYGFHFAGNYGYVNDLQRLVVDENTQKNQCSQIIDHKIDGVKKNKVVKRQFGEIYKDGCWICEGWREVDLSWYYGPSGTGYQSPAFLLLDHKGWEGVYLGKIDKPSKSYQHKRMLPPGVVYFLYAFKFREQVNRKFKRVSSQMLQPLIVDYADQQKQVHLLAMNQLEKSVRPISLDHEEEPEQEGLINEEYVANISILPRSNDLVYVPPREKKEKVPWDFNKSLFKPYQVDSEELLRKCFEFDFQCSRIPRVIKDEEDLAGTKATLWEHYKGYKNCYKYYSGLNPIGETWCLQSLEFHSFVDVANIKDSHLRHAECDLKFVGTNANPDMKGPRNPERGLVRFQFQESLVRMADEKYIKAGSASTYKEAVEKLYQEHCLPEFNKYDHQAFRDNTYWTEFNEQVILTYKQQIEGLYNKFSVKKVNPGQKKFMCLEELLDIFKTSGLLLDALLQEQDIYLSFNLAIQTQVDELHQNRVFQMSLLEFYEALARIAHRLSLPQVGITRLSPPERQEQELHFKFEAMVHRLLEYYFKEQVVQHPLPKKSMFDLDADSELSSEEEGVEEPLPQVQNEVLEQADIPFRSAVRKSIQLGMKPFKVKEETEEQRKEKEQLEQEHMDALDKLKYGALQMINQEEEEEEEEEEYKE